MPRIAAKEDVLAGNRAPHFAGFRVHHCDSSTQNEIHLVGRKNRSVVWGMTKNPADG